VIFTCGPTEIVTWANQWGRRVVRVVVALLVVLVLLVVPLVGALEVVCFIPAAGESYFYTLLQVGGQQL
jgi:hypothetical protein